MPELTEDDKLAGRYQLIDELGRGGFGVVWRARDTTTGEDVAVKHPNYDSKADDDLVDKYFQREIDVLEEISDAGGHPNIVSYHGTDGDGGLPYVVLEHIDGHEAGELVDQDTVTDPDELRAIGIGICEALSFMHEHDIIYRDLKPDNIMIEGGGTPKIIDFTTAKGFVPEQGAPEFSSGEGDGDDSTVPGEFKPPELNRGGEQRQGPWSDVYSVGKILCFLLVGWVPDDDGVTPGEFGVDAPDYLGDIVSTATQHDRADRYPNASVLRTALENRDPSMPEQASLTWLGRDETWTISPGDTVGRDHPEGPQPSVVLEDREHRALSAVHCRLDTDGDGDWYLVDTSLNGTYISKHDEQDWQLLLSAEGQRRRREAGASIDGNPETRTRLEDGDVVALVDPQYPERFYFQFST
jgi:serine/threonine protein kinase